MSTATIQLRAESRQIRTATDDLKALERQGSATDRTAQILTRTLGALGAALSVRQLTEYTNTWTDLNSRILNVTKDGKLAAEVMQSISDTADRTYSSLTDTAEAFLANATTLTELGYTTQQQIKLSEALNNALVVSGTKGQAAASVMDALSKSFATGELRGENFNSVIARGGRIVEALAAGLGVGTLELRKMASEGQLTTQKVFEALTSQAEKLAAEADAMAATVGDGFVRIGNAALQTVGRFDQLTGASSSVAGVLVSISESIKNIDDENLVRAAAAMDLLLKAGVAVAAVYGARVVSAIVASTKAKVNEIATTAILERAENARSVANAQRAARHAAATQAEIALNARRLQSSVAALEAERAQELVRMRAQVSTIGRIQSASRLAEIELARTAIVRQLTVAESQLVAATTAATAANARLTAAAAAGTVAIRAKAAAVRAASASLALLGGPVGAAILAAGALYYFTDANREAERRSKALADETGNLVNKYKELNDVGRQVTISKLNTEASDYRQRLVEARAELERLQAQQIKGGSGGLGLGGVSQVVAISRAEGKVKELEQALGDVTSKMTALFDSTLPGEWKSLSEDIEQSSTATVKLNRNFEQLSQSLQQQIIELRDGRQAAEDYAIAQRLGTDATEAQRQAIAGQVAELRALQAAQEAQSRIDSLRQGIGRDIQSGMSPLQQLEAELYQRQQMIERFRQEGALSDAEARQSEIDAITAFETRKRQLYQETAEQQNQSLNLINWESFENRAAGALSMVATGAMSGREAIQGLAMSIVQEGIGALIKMGIQYVTTTAMQTAAATAATATTTAAAVASGAAITAAMAPAAAATSIATAGAAPAAAAPIALSTIGAIIAGLVGGAVLAGKRRQGGQVTRGNSYLVGEQGPELITMGGNARVTPFNQLMQKAESGGGGNPQVNLMVNISKQEGAQDSVTGRQVQDKYILDVVVGSMDSRGAVFNSVVRNTTAQGRTR